jgi:hypothetical protein
MHGTQGLTLSKSEFAAAVGVSPGRVSQLVRDGLPVEADGRVNIDAGKAWIAANIDPRRRRALPSDTASRRSSRAERDSAEAEIAKLRAARLAGDVIDRDATLCAIETRARFERDAWIGWTNRAAPEIARTVNADLAAIVAVLDRLVRDQLATLAATPVEGIEMQ